MSADSWLRSILKLDAESVITELLQDLKLQVVMPAIAFSRMLRQRFTPLQFNQPQNLQKTVETWYKTRFEHEGSKPQLTIFVQPELRKIDLETSTAEKLFSAILVEAEKYTIVNRTDVVE